MCLRQRQGFFGILSDKHLIASVLQNSLRHLGVYVVVLDQKNENLLHPELPFLLLNVERRCGDVRFATGA
jgi:hypothetical protein